MIRVFTNSNRRILSAFTLSIMLAACGSGSSGGGDAGVDVTPVTGADSATTDASALTPATSERDWLKSEVLFDSEYPHSSPIHNSYFLPVGEKNEPLHRFSGRIRIDSRRIQGSFAANYIAGEESFKNFPDVALEFVSHEDTLIPVNRLRQLDSNDDSFWGIILDPGMVWSEVADDGWSRASFPLSFISARRNQVHNGVASFLYNDTEISNLRFQITQETALWFKQDMYGQLRASYVQTEFSNETQLIDAFIEEQSNTVSIRPWGELEALSQSANTRQFNSSLRNSDISSAGVIVDGEVYAQPCYTRYGEYPFCRWMRNGAYSVTKSLGASLTMMRLAQKYGSQVYDLKIIDYVNVAVFHEDWQEVTFANVLNMASGFGDNGTIRNSGDIFADENTSKMESWLVMPALASKLNVSFSYQNYSWGPGTVFRYNSAMTIILAAAMDGYYKSIEGTNADLWNMMVEEVFHPIGIQHVPILRTDEPNSPQGIAELFHGLYLNVDDLAKLTMLLQGDGSYSDVQLIHQEKLRESLFQTTNQGLHSWWEDNNFGQSRYLYSFWSSPYSDNAGCEEQVPYMSGYGGNIVAILPNNISLYRFADANSYSPFDMIQASVNERPVCY